MRRLSQLLDVGVFPPALGPADGQALAWNAALQKWIPLAGFTGEFWVSSAEGGAADTLVTVVQGFIVEPDEEPPPSDDIEAAVMADSPTGYWRLGESSGNAADSSGNGYDATATATITYGVAGIAGGGANTAVSMATSGYFTSATIAAAFLGATKGTLEAWIYRTAGTMAAFGFSHPADSDNEFCVNWYSDNKVYCSCGRTADGGASYWNFDASAFTGWVHVVFTWDGTQGTAANRDKLYLNGTSVGSLTVGGANPATQLPATLTTFYIGRLASGADIHSAAGFDEVACYAGVVLTSGQVAAHYAAGI